jgi:hypothetical protein
VTFNYDSLLEQAFPDPHFTITKLSDYVVTHYKMIKLHGSVNWGHEVKNQIPNLERMTDLRIATELINNASDLDLGESFYIIPAPPQELVTQYPKPQFPALTIPIENKSEYECPSQHWQMMEAALPQVTDMILVGWRASERNFLQSLADNIPNDTRIMVVSSDEKRALELIQHVQQAGLIGNFTAAKGGFSHAILSGALENFLQDWH